MTGILGLLVAAVAAWPGTAQSPPRQEPRTGVHLGVATCLGSNCHGAVDRPPGSAVAGNEYIIWSKRDKHHDAYRVLTEDRAIRMARAIGLSDAVNQKLCLDCHADNVPANLRGPEFHLQDEGVGCEACHGGASGWLGIHISGATHQQNVQAGLYPTEQPDKRAERCLGCHFGDETKFVDHRLIGAGHPRLRFELDTFTAIQPAHFQVTKSYVERKGRITDLQVWATGQAIALVKRMDALLDPKRARHGLFPEFVFYDCQSCHHVYDSLHAPRPTMTGLGPGTVKFNDANAVMLRVAAARVAPAAARALSEHMLALHRASNDDWAGMQHEAAAVREAAASLASALTHREFTHDDMQAMAETVIALGLEAGDAQFSHDEQIAMALGAIRAGLVSAGYLNEAQTQASAAALDALNNAFPNEETLRADAFTKALREFQRALGR
jgi:hypothetical protein